MSATKELMIEQINILQERLKKSVETQDQATELTTRNELNRLLIQLENVNKREVLTDSVTHKCCGGNCKSVLKG